MKRKNLFLLMPLLCAAAALAVFIFGSSDVSAAPGGTLRLGGETRMETSFRISDEGWPEGADTVIVASGLAYPDAMAGVPLAGMLDAPILLTGEQPDESLMAQLDRLGANNVLILGGEKSVGPDVEFTLHGTGRNVERIYGADRYATCAAIARRMAELGDISHEVFVASGANFPDALSVSPAAGVMNQPILYAAPDGELSPEITAFIRDCGITGAVIAGGETAVPPVVVERLGAAGIIRTERISGTDRYQTSLAVNRRYSSVLDSEDVALASGENFPDALSGGAFAARRAMPVVLLTNRASIPGAYEFVSDRAGTRYILGLEGALSAYTVNTFLSGGTITTTTTTTTTTAPKPQSTGKKAYLTFDDGPSANTGKILDILDKYDAKATFFVIYRPGYESTYKEIVRRGHTLALHSYTHRYSDIYKSTSAYFDDLNRLSDYLYSLTGVRSKTLRFPGGSSNLISRSYSKGIMTRLTSEVEKRGYRYYDWNVDSGDADANCVKASTLVANIKKRCGSQKSAIILMHDAPAKTTTVTALPDIIRYLRSKGYELLPITSDTTPVHHGVNN